MWKKTGVTILVIVIIGVVSLHFLTKVPDLSLYEPIKEPRITMMKARKMVAVEAKRDPNVVGSKAFGLLFKAYFKLDGDATGPKQPAPRARWSGNINDKY